MIETTNLKLKKYEDNDVTDPALAFNPNMDIIEQAFSNISTDAKGTKFDNATNGMTSTNVQGAIEEVFQAGVNAKANMVQAINSKKTVPNVSKTDSWNTLSQKVKDIKEGSGNANASEVLAGKTFTNNDGIEYAGTMPNRLGIINANGTARWGDGGVAVYLPHGYYNGVIGQSEIKVTEQQIRNVEGNIQAENILSGKSIFGVWGNVQRVTPITNGESYFLFNREASNSHVINGSNTFVIGNVPMVVVGGYARFSVNINSSSFPINNIYVYVIRDSDGATVFSRLLTSSTNTWLTNYTVDNVPIECFRSYTIKLSGSISGADHLYTQNVQLKCSFA